MIVEDTASQSSVVFGVQDDWRDPISGVHVSPGSAETLVRRGWITYFHSLAYSLVSVFAKKITKIGWCALKLLYATSVSFFWDTVYRLSYSHLPFMIETFELLMKSCEKFDKLFVRIQCQLHVHLKKWTLMFKLLYLRTTSVILIKFTGYVVWILAYKV